MIELACLLTLALLFAWREHTLIKERRDWADERAGLLNRIKPETAQATRLPEDIETPQPEPETDYLTEDGMVYGDVRANGGS